MNYQTNLCPVPKDQIPFEEFITLSKSWFFAWPLNDQNQLESKLFISWILSLPFNIIISSGSQFLRHDIAKNIIISSTISIIIPLIILLRQWLGWSYISKRLYSENVIYEQTGWYDGKKWEKPISWRERDFLIAQFEVKPVIDKITNILFILLIFFLTSIMLIPFLLN